MTITKRLLICLVIFTHLSACAARQPIPAVSEAQRERLGVVGVVQLTRAPKSELDVGPRGRVAGAAQGAGRGALFGLAATAPGAAFCSDEYCAVIFALLVGGAAVTGAMVGGVVGAVQAVPDDTARQIEAQLNLALSEVGQQEAFRSEVVKVAARSGVPNVKEITVGATTTSGAAIDYRALAELDVDTALEVGLLLVGLVGSGGKDPQLTLGVHAVARLVDVKSNIEVYHNYALDHDSSPRKFSEWSADDAHLLKAELNRAYGILATSIVDEGFLAGRSN